MLRYAHIFIADHMISTGWTLLFAMWWYVYTPHDGKPVSNSNHQAGLMTLIESLESEYRTPEEMATFHHANYTANTTEAREEAARRAKAANGVWMEERGFSAGVLASGWLLKVGLRSHPDLLCPGPVRVCFAPTPWHLLDLAAVQVAVGECGRACLRVPVCAWRRRRGAVGRRPRRRVCASR